MKNKKYIIVCVNRFLTTLPMTVAAVVGAFEVRDSLLRCRMTAKQKGREKRIVETKQPLYAPFSHMKHVMPNGLSKFFKQIEMTRGVCTSSKRFLAVLEISKNLSLVPKGDIC